MECISVPAIHRLCLQKVRCSWFGFVCLFFLVLVFSVLVFQQRERQDLGFTLWWAKLCHHLKVSICLYKSLVLNPMSGCFVPNLCLKLLVLEGGFLLSCRLWRHMALFLPWWSLRLCRPWEVAFPHSSPSEHAQTGSSCPWQMRCQMFAAFSVSIWTWGWKDWALQKCHGLPAQGEKANIPIKACSWSWCLPVFFHCHFLSGIQSLSAQVLTVLQKNAWSWSFSDPTQLQLFGTRSLATVLDYSSSFGAFCFKNLNNMNIPGIRPKAIWWHCWISLPPLCFESIDTF